MTTSISDIGKEYFLKVPSKKWAFSTAYTAYKTMKLPPTSICQLMESDLEYIRKNKTVCSTYVNQMCSELQFLRSVIAEELSSTHPSEQQVMTGSMEENYNNCTNITKNVFQEISSTGKRKGGDSSSKDNAQAEASTSSPSVSVKRMKKNYTFYPPNMKPSISTDKPRINDDDASKIGDLFVTMIDPRSGDKVVDSQRQEYDKHMEDQRLLSSIKNKPKTFKALDSILQGTLDDLLNAFGHVDNNHGDDDERQELALLRYLLCDYHANCIKPTYAILPNERTTFAEYVIPIFKYFSATTGLVSFIWCEKSSPSFKLSTLYLPGNQRKLMDGIGFSCKDNIERLLIECSGEADNDHTEEDTLKLMECTSRCLKHEMNQHRQASWTTFGQRQLFAVQSIGNKLTLLSTRRLTDDQWCFVEVRSAIVPRLWGDRYYLFRVMELLLTLKESLMEQDKLTVTLQRQQVGVDFVDAADSIDAMINKKL